MRRADPPADMAAELRALDDILAGRPVPPESQDLAEIVSIVRDDAPEMSAAFTARLERRVSERFRRAQDRRWRVRPALGGVAAIAAAAIVAVVLGASGGSQSSSSSSRTSGSSAALPASSSLASPSSVAGAQRQVQRSASLSLFTSPERVQDVAAGVSRVTEQFGGIVASSNISIGDAGQTGSSRGSATFSLSIPSSRLEAALSALSALGQVRARSESSDDITAPYNAARDRLAQDRAARRSLLAQLAGATTPGALDSLRQRLRDLSSQISADANALGALRQQAGMSSVTVTLDSGRSGPGGSGFTLSQAWHDAAHVLGVAAGTTVLVLAALIPLLVLGATVAIALRVHRRRRERGLDRP